MPHIHSRLHAASRVLVVAAFALVACEVSQAGEDETWQLVMRKLANGTVLKPPAVMGVSSWHHGTYSLVVYWTTPDGKPVSVSEIHKYKWSKTELEMTPMLNVFDDGSGKPAVYTVGGETKKAQLEKTGKRISYQHPLDPVFIVEEEDGKSTATTKDAFTDYWERMR